MIEPAVDKLIQKAGCKYGLVCVISKRARKILGVNLEEPQEITSAMAISQAANEIFNDEVVVKPGSLNVVN